MSPLWLRTAGVICKSTKAGPSTDLGFTRMPPLSRRQHGVMKVAYLSGPKALLLKLSQSEPGLCRFAIKQTALSRQQLSRQHQKPERCIQCGTLGREANRKIK